MQTKDKVLDGVARIAGTGMSVISGAKRQIREEIRTRAEDMADRMDLVPRDEFERLKIMLGEMRQEQDKLKERILLLEETCQK